MNQTSRLPSSFRDPCGFLFEREGILYRQVNQTYAGHYRQLVDSGLYDRLVKAGMLVPHREVDVTPAEPTQATLIICPERLPFISYPYEWSFSQLQDAALLTLAIQKAALERGMSLKDASAYNIQFQNGKPVLIDTLSFEPYPEGQPWIAYRQYCQHFLAPLALMSHSDVRLAQLLRVYIDGIPLDLASRLLPARTRLSLPLLLHIHLHAASQQRYAGAAAQPGRPMAQTALLGLVDSLDTGVRGLRWSQKGTPWGGYYQDHNYSEAGLDHKGQLVGEYLDVIGSRLQPRLVWDLGANTGRFSRLASERGFLTVAFDLDPGAVEAAYRAVRTEGESRLLPIQLDLTNPSPGLGWDGRERQSLAERGPAGAILALALIHHLAIANNLPFDRLAAFFHRLARWLVVEFIPKEDSQVQRLLASREDIFPDYNAEIFERIFSRKFVIHRVESIQESSRRLYLMEGRE